MAGNGTVSALGGAPLRAAALAMALAGCGGGGPPAAERAPVLSERDAARVARLGALRGRADALAMTGLRARWSLSAGGDGMEDALVGPVTCSGARCVAADGAATAARDLLDLSGGDGAGAAVLGGRGGFDTVRTAGALTVTETLPGLSVEVPAEVESWGFWGEHGFAALTLVAGPLAAEVSGTAFSGRFSSAQAWAAGAASGGGPSGTGGAVWTGIAEAGRTGTSARVPGTATLTVADLSRPAVDAAIALDGVGTPLRWDGMELAGGRFASGTAGTDRLEGRFHGPAHEEAYGVFDTGDWVGAFGARRAP